MTKPPKSNPAETDETGPSTAPDDADRLEGIASQDMQFIAYLEGDLGADERNKFRQDLLRDPKLRGDFDAFSEIISATKSLPLEPLPADFIDKLQARIRTESNGRFFNPSAVYRSYIPYEAVSAAMILLMAAAWITLSTPRDQHLQYINVTTPPQLQTAQLQTAQFQTTRH